jgi:hypothetical protein
VSGGQRSARVIRDKAKAANNAAYFERHKDAILRFREELARKAKAVEQHTDSAE